MTVRKILSARSARAKVEELLGALVHAAVYIGGADGRFGEEELEVFIDSMREVMSAAVGPELLDDLASTPRLLDRARAARRELQARGADRFLAELAPRFPGAFARDGLVLAYRIVLADGQVTAREALAFDALAAALGLDVAEVAVLKELAAHAERASRAGHRAEHVEAVRALAGRGWALVDAGDVDAGVRAVRGDGVALLLELDAGDAALHVRVVDAEGRGPHLVCFFHDALPSLLSALDGLRETLRPSTLGEHLPALRAACPDLFVEHEGRYARL